MIRITLFLGLMVVLIQACTSPLTREQELALYRTRCLEYGYQPGTVEFAQCMETQDRLAVENALKERHLRALEQEQHLQKKERKLKEKEAATSTLKVNLW